MFSVRKKSTIDIKHMKWMTSDRILEENKLLRLKLKKMIVQKKILCPEKNYVFKKIFCLKNICVSYQRLSSIKGCLPSKVLFHLFLILR